ncbi:efflux RND transporter periplasmic adaptor subunit [Novosphingobium sp. G106]|uniref:efflux RND transporter periplasmic adaptor subunit n=1 Tax=Novosphingobium sp. G106 TaxID=2849500 RepID=UPI0020C4237B|nr:efflux RND transporter periplasmic adaptor subunit [Novosphingobium sp. G106]
MNQTADTGDRPETARKPWFWIGIIIIGLLAAAAIAHFVVGIGSKGDRNRRLPAPVAIAKVTYADVPETVSALGTVTPLVTASVRSQQSGRLMEIDFKEGQTVAKGQRLALIDPRPFALASAQADANLARDAAQLNSARVDLTRYRTLQSQDSIARQQVDSQAALVKQLEGTVGADRAALGTARLNLTYASVISPVSGRIGLRQTDIGNYVTPADTNGIATVTQLDPIDVEFSVPQAQISAIQARLGAGGGGLPVTAIDQSGAPVLAQGTLLTFDNVVDTTTGTIKAKARFANPGGKLIPNQFVNVAMLTGTLHHAMVVPVSAVRHGQPGDFVFVLQPDKTVKLVVVKIGPMLGQQVAILAGLKGDETVISAGADGLEDGSSVRLPGDKSAGGKGAGGGGGGKHGHRHKSQSGG